MYLIQRAISNTFARGIAPLVPTTISESTKNLLQAAINFVLRYLRICLRWTTSQIHRAITALWVALRVEDVLHFIQVICIYILKWCGIALATVAGVIIVGRVGYWGLPKLWNIYTERRRRKLEEERWNNARKQQERLQEERLAKQAAAAAALRESNARKAREEQAIKVRVRLEEEERRAKARTDYQKWEHEREVAFRDKASMTSLPFPPLPRCTTPSCPALAKRPPPACRHNVKQFLQGSGEFSSAFLKHQRSYWHEDRFASCREDLRLDFQRRANTLFVILQSLYEESITSF